MKASELISELLRTVLTEGKDVEVEICDNKAGEESESRRIITSVESFYQDRDLEKRIVVLGIY